MVAAPEVLAIVQARGGSKGLPRKNVRPLCGHPLMAYSIASARAASTINRVIVSTDDAQIADIATRYGAEVPFARPAEIAGDDTLDFPVLEHALRWLCDQEEYKPDVVVQLRPTTPFRPRGMLDEAVRLLCNDPEADCVRGVTIPKQTPYKMWRSGDNGYISPLLQTTFNEPFNMPRQQLPVAYWQTGHVDAIRTCTITEKHSLTGQRVCPLIVERDYCVDIDSLADFDLAERALLQRNLEIDMPAPVDAHDVERSLPESVELVVFDFDGVFTDNHVMVFDDGREAVLCDRSDGMGISLLQREGVPVVVLSTETNPVVDARCRKLGIECEQGLSDKASVLRKVVSGRCVDWRKVVYVGNDVNDLGCMQRVGLAVAVADAHPSVLEKADIVLTRRGGDGAVREACDMLLRHLSRKEGATCRG